MQRRRKRGELRWRKARRGERKSGKEQGKTEWMARMGVRGGGSTFLDIFGRSRTWRKKRALKEDCGLRNGLTLPATGYLSQMMRLTSSTGSTRPIWTKGKIAFYMNSTVPLRSRGILGSLADTFQGLYDTYVADYVTNQYRDFVEGYTDATLKVRGLAQYVSYCFLFSCSPGSASAVSW